MKRGTETVGHVPRTISCVCMLFPWQLGPYPVKLQGAADRARRLIAILVTHDVIDWLELYVSIYSDVQIFVNEIFADGC